jgi:hypothetical protein
MGSVCVIEPLGIVTAFEHPSIGIIVESNKQEAVQPTSRFIVSCLYI